MIKIINVKDLDDNKGVVGIDIVVILTQLHKIKSGKMKGKMMGLIRVADTNTWDLLTIPIFNNPNAILRYNTGSQMIIYGTVKPAVYGKKGLVKEAGLSFKSINATLIVPVNSK